MKSFLIVATALAISSLVATAQTAPANTSTTTVRASPMNSTTDRMADQNGLQTSSTMSKRDITRQNNRAAKKKAKASDKMNSSMDPKM